MTSRRLRLLVLTSTFPRWNNDHVPRFVADLCVSLSKRMDVTVLAPASDGAEDVELLDLVEVRRFRYSWPGRTQRLADGAILPNIRRNPLLFAQVPMLLAAELVATRKLLGQRRFDVIHAHWTVPQGLVASLLKRRTNLPLLTTTHGSDINALRYPLMPRLKRYVLRSSDLVTAVSEQLRRAALTLGACPERTLVVPMGVDTKAFSPERASASLRQRLVQDGPMLLSVGRLADVKGFRFLIDAMPSILREAPRARLIMIGDGPERGSLERQAVRLGIASSIEFMGALPNAELAEYYASADVFIGPSIVLPAGDAESFGITFAEAMASGCPVVASDIDGLHDVTNGGDSALLVAPEDPPAIAKAVNRLLGDAALRKRMSERALAVARNRFSRDRLHERYGDLIEQLAA